MTSHSPDRITLALFDRYLAGECTPAEVSLVERWMAASPAHHMVTQALRSAAPIALHVDGNLASVRERVMSLPRTAGDAQTGVQRPARRDLLVGRSDTEQGATPEGQRLGTQPPGARLGLQEGQPARRPRAYPRRGGIWSAAAALGVGLAAVLVVWQSGMRHADSSAAQSRHAYSTYSTANGQRSIVALPDSTTIMLNVGSQVTVPFDYTTGNRTVHLVGEGLFTVSHRGGAPFTVVAGAASARVLGTSFVVRHYPTDRSTMISVADGKVGVGSVMLTARQMVEVDGRHASHVQASDASAFSFATGTLTITKLPLSDAILELGRWYDVDIRLSDPRLASRHVSGEFAAASLADFAEILELAFDVRTVRAGRVLTLYPRR